MVDEYIKKWHEDYQPDPHSKVEDIFSGLRATSDGRSKDDTAPCQYWVKGLPGICVHYDGDKCINRGDAQSDGSTPTRI